MESRDKADCRMSRREFIARSTAATLAASLGSGGVLAAQERFHPVPSSPLPTRIFGKTGIRLPILTFGCGSRFVSYDEDTWPKVLNEAIDSGIIYLDTAHMYGDGVSEERIGRLMKQRRKDVLLQTKIFARDKDEWWAELELSLKRLNTDYVDSLMIHELGNDEDLAKLEVPGGPIEQLFKAKEQHLTRWIGVSNHADSSTLVKLLRRHQVDVVQCALNVATNGARDLGFEETALPVAVEKGVGVIAMKVMGQDQIVGKYPQFDYAKCLRYVLSLPVTTATVGMPKPEHLVKNLDLVHNFKPYSPEEMLGIKQEGESIKTSFRLFMAGHSDFA